MPLTSAPLFSVLSTLVATEWEAENPTWEEKNPTSHVGFSTCVVGFSATHAVLAALDWAF